MTFLIILLFFLIGLVIGSFLNVVILRGERGEGLGGRSRCMQCARTLGIGELIPVASFILQGGRCRGCKERFSVQYPLVEMGTALAFAAVAAYMLAADSGLNIGILKYLNIAAACVAFGAGLVILVSDLRFQIIPDGAVLALLVVAVSRIPIQLFQTKIGTVGTVPAVVWNGVIRDVISALVIAFFFFLLWFVSRGRWMGFGDVKLIAATSLLLGYPAAIAAALFAFWIGGAMGTALLLTGKKAWGSRMPFGPCILAGAGAAWLWADTFFAFTGLGLLL